MYYLGYVLNYVVLDIGIIPHAQQGHNLNNYGGALMCSIPQAITPNPHTNFVNVYIQIANKVGFQQNKKSVLQFGNLYTIYIIHTIYIKLHSVPSEYSRLCSTSYY
jgi:hypothetical protein